MGLATFNSVLRWIIALSSGGAFGLDMWFVYIRRNYEGVVFTWQYYVQTSLAGVLFLIIVLSEGSHQIDRRRRRQQLIHQQPEQLQMQPQGPHGPYLPPVPIVTPSTTHRRRNMFWSAFRFLTVWLICACLLDITVKAILKQDRFAYYDISNPRNLYACPRDWDSVQAPLCQFNQQAIHLSTLAAGLAIFEAILTAVLQNRTRAHVAANDMSSQELPKAEADAFNEAELGRAPVIANTTPASFTPTFATSAPSPVAPAPISSYSSSKLPPVSLYNAYHPTPEAQGSSSDRPLPPLPPHFASGQDDGTGSSNAYIQPAIASPAYDTSAAVGPSNAYPLDKKHPDGY
ncbi:hypothetical protein B0O80DRAFT_421731 [Mortierella sp. GBAus27b]|nr:hypothetical protein BGX31_002092 [Mortierella sp. GBA43]KAI8362164.1 hypothetical protein B0O80DRAFT_421731 [Mortierella sp. GBAus27b]